MEAPAANRSRPHTSSNYAEPGRQFDVEIPVRGMPLGVAARIEVYVEAVPGETDLENNKSTYLAIFEVDSAAPRDASG